MECYSDEVLDLKFLGVQLMDISLKAFKNLATRAYYTVATVEDMLEGVISTVEWQANALPRDLVRLAGLDREGLNKLAGNLSDVLAQVSAKIKAFRETFSASEAGKACLVLSDVAKKIRGDGFKFFSELSEFFKQFNLIKSGIQLYLDYQSWLEEIHFSQKVEETLGEAKR